MSNLSNQTIGNQILSCSISGIPLLSIQNLSGGVWPLVTKLETVIAHPIYDLPIDSLLSKLSNLLAQADKQQYQLSENTTQQLQLTISSVLRSINCLVNTHNKPSGLPGPGVIVGTGDSLLKIAKWHSKLIKKPALPKYRPTEAWLNFGAWIESSLAIYNDWHGAKHKEEDAIQAALDADVDIRKVYKKIDKNKVWNWITTQVGTEVHAGRLTTMQTLFLTDNINPLEWLSDDVDDLTEIIHKYCDPSNDIIHYIMSHCNSMRTQIREYNSGFSLNTSYDAPSELINSNEAKESETLSSSLKSYHTQVESLTSLSELKQPTKNDYPKLIDFLKAQSEYRILVKLFNERNKI